MSLVIKVIILTSFFFSFQARLEKEVRGIPGLEASCPVSLPRCVFAILMSKDPRRKNEEVSERVLKKKKYSSLATVVVNQCRRLSTPSLIDPLSP